GAPSKGAGWNVVGVGDFGGPVTAPPASKPQSDILWRNTATGEVSVWYMNGEGFVEDRPIAGPTIRDQNWQIEGVGNFNDDLQADIIWRNRATGQNLVWLMDGAAVRTAVEIPAVSREWTLAGSGDYNGDRKSDLVWRNQSTGENVVWLMNGTTINRRVGIDPLASGATIVQN
ncbi:MAG: hypothetical protein HC857_09445, partial [Synechococcales cyanobacterium RU_4_20]|nr:hypothetical protein [Synechococcales cyanobacterium RU_4_20]